MTATITRRDALRVAADALERSGWLADEGDENASENADAIVRILREEAAGVRPDPFLARLPGVPPEQAAHLGDWIRRYADRFKLQPREAMDRLINSLYRLHEEGPVTDQ